MFEFGGIYICRDLKKRMLTTRLRRRKTRGPRETPVAKDFKRKETGRKKNIAKGRNVEREGDKVRGGGIEVESTKKKTEKEESGIERRRGGKTE